MGAALARIPDTRSDHCSAHHPGAQQTSGGAHAALQDAGRAATERIAAAPSHVVKRVPPLSSVKLRHGGCFDGLSNAQCIELGQMRLEEGPSIIGPFPIHVAGVLVRQQNFFVWVENGEIAEWLEAEQLPVGGYRRGAWLMWTNGHAFERILDRPTDPMEMQARAPQLEGRMLERRVETSQELNRDLEHFVATGSSISQGRILVEHAHQAVLSELIQGTFQVFSAWAGMESAAESIEALGKRIGNMLHVRNGRAVAASPQQHAVAEIWRRSETLVQAFPHLGKLTATAENLAGMQRLADLFDDAHLTPELRERFLTQAKAHVGAQQLPPQALHDELMKVAHAEPGRFLRQGARPNAAELSSMGGLKRAVSLKAVLFSLTTDDWYAHAAHELKLPPDRAQLDWRFHGELLVEGYRAHRIGFDPANDLNPRALVQGRGTGSSGWYFSAADAGNATSSPAMMMAKLAVGPEYAHGYLLLDLPLEVAIANGAARPTAIDLTLSPAGRLNPARKEHVGRTAPTQVGQKSVREVVVGPVPLAAVSEVQFVPGGGPRE